MISVIVPVYNVERYIVRCVRSLMNQTYRDLEIILVDDGSTDESGLLCDKLAAEDSRIKMIHKENGGLSSARNIGIDNACGKYFAFVDGDDYVHPQMLEILLSNLISHNADISVCNAYIVQIGETVTNEGDANSVEVFHRDEAIFHMDQIRVVAWNKLYKREIFHECRYPEGRMHEDEAIFHRVIYRCNRIVYTEKRLYYYVVRDDSIMKTIDIRKVYDAMYALKDRLEFSKEKEWKVAQPWALERVLKYVTDNYGKSYIYAGQETEIKKYLYNEFKDILRSNRTIIVPGVYKLFYVSPYLYQAYICLQHQRNRIEHYFKRKIGKRKDYGRKNHYY